MKKNILILFFGLFLLGCEKDKDFRDEIIGTYNCSIIQDNIDLESGSIKIKKAETENRVILTIVGLESDFDILCDISEIGTNIYSLSLLSNQSFNSDGITYKISKISSTNIDGKIINDTKSIVFQFKLNYSFSVDTHYNMESELQFNGKK